MDIFFSSEAWIALLTLTFLEIVLGVDNIIFISIISNKLPHSEQHKARNMGLILALIFRIILLFGISALISFSQPLFTLFSIPLSGKDLILGAGGFFLIGKSITEIHHKMEGEIIHVDNKLKRSLINSVIQIAVINIVFSFDSILTAFGLTQEIPIMIIAVIISLGIMMLFSSKISSFIQQHPTLEVLALSFLILIGFMLVLEGLQFHVPKGYIYFAVFFSCSVEFLNIKLRKKSKPVQLHHKIN
jgi:predicted tellurium resistance membrane protein TerC